MTPKSLIIAHSYDAAKLIAVEHDLEEFTYVYSTAKLRGLRPDEQHVDETIYIQDNPPKFPRNWADLVAEARRAAQYDGFEIKRVST